MSKRKFTWDCWDFDTEGDAYVVSKDECPIKENVLEYICDKDYVSGTEQDININFDALVKEGWCCFQCRSDWDNGFDGGGYVVEEGNEKPTSGRGWFPVWIVRSDRLFYEGL